MNCTPNFDPQIMPATSATSPATHHTITQMRLSGMPMDCAAWWSSATARSARPVEVYWKKRASAATSSAAMTAAVRSSRLMSSPPSKTESRISSGSLGMPTLMEYTELPNVICPSPSRK
ncbi:hypothetical protein D3C72_1951300 [compost metagenome]